MTQSYALSYNTGIIFLSETFLDSSIEASDANINISRCNSLRSDPSNTKRGSVCMFYKYYLPIIRRDDLCALSESAVTEIKLGKKTVFFTCNYRFPSQTPDEFENYCQNLHFTVSNIDDISLFCSIVFGDFSSRCRNWWAGDVNSNAGKVLDSLTSTAGYTQLIDKATHFISGGSSYVDLIFCNKPEIFSEYGIDDSLFQTCYHNLIFAKISANVSLLPNCRREVWDYKMPMLKEYKNPYIFFIEKKLLKTYQLMRKFVFLTTPY